MARKATRTRHARRTRTVRERPGSHATGGTSVAGIQYIESSALLAALIEGDPGVRSLLKQDARRIASALTFAECKRALVRGVLTGRLSANDEGNAVRALDAIAEDCAVVPISTEILQRAGRRFPVEPVRTLDAIHLATLELLGLPRDKVVVLSGDRRIRENAERLGYAVV